jgi:tRNA (uracil-5-)-methyltransferase TRM9
MQPETQTKLLALNQRFYATVADPFDATRLATPPGKVALVTRLPLRNRVKPTPVLDIGCGNGRLAWLLEERGKPIDYVGVDANPDLLTRAQLHTLALHHVQARFVQADLADPTWTEAVPRPAKGFAVVVCLATLHHLPGMDLRRRVMQDLAALVAPTGLIAISTWQFLTSVRMAAKVLDWAVVGIDPNTVDPGDALLPWQQGGYAVRYVHQVDATEVADLAAHAGLRVVDSYLADGKEGNLNLYTLLRRTPEGSSVDPGTPSVPRNARKKRQEMHHEEQ